LRLLGIQEPASALFSVLNLASNLYMLLWFVQKGTVLLFHQKIVNVLVIIKKTHTRYKDKSGGLSVSGRLFLLDFIILFHRDTGISERRHCASQGAYLFLPTPSSNLQRYLDARGTDEHTFENIVYTVPKRGVTFFLPSYFLYCSYTVRHCSFE
jgi:hypothetical protein